MNITYVSKQLCYLFKKKLIKTLKKNENKNHKYFYIPTLKFNKKKWYKKC